MPQASPEDFPSNAKNDTFLAGAWGQTVNFNKLWVTVSDKSPSFYPSKLGGIFHKTLFPHMQGHTMTHVCVCVCGRGFSLLCLITLWCGFSHEGIRQDTFSQDVLHISKLLNRTESTFFHRCCCWISEGCLSSSHTHTHTLAK